MTAYYLRKLIHANQSQLIWNDNERSPSVEQAIMNSVSERLRDIAFPSVIEQLVTLHQSLLTAEQTDRHQLHSLELQIYEILGLQKKKSLDTRSHSDLKKLNYSPQKYRNLLGQLYRTRRKLDSLINPKVTLNYLEKTCPDKSWRLISSASDRVHQPIEKQILRTKNPLEIYERWTTLLCDLCESILPAMANEMKHIADGSSEEQNNERSIELAWLDLQQTANVAFLVSDALSPKRSRDALKLLNALICKSALLIGAIRTRTYLLESRPNDEWCHMFVITDIGTVKYSGNIRELVTNTRLKMFGQWMEQFWQMCEAMREDVTLPMNEESNPFES